MTGVMAGIRVVQQRRGEALAPGVSQRGSRRDLLTDCEWGSRKRVVRGSEGVGLSQGRTGGHHGGEGCWERRPGGFWARALCSLMSEWGC